jgi:hypothetical protein
MCNDEGRTWQGYRMWLIVSLRSEVSNPRGSHRFQKESGVEAMRHFLSRHRHMR